MGILIPAAPRCCLSDGLPTNNQVLPSDDPLDRADFDPVAYINSRFPSEVSAERLDPFVADVNAQIATLDEEISRSVQAQAEVRATTHP